MSQRCVIDVDLADVWSKPGRKGFLHTLGWGDFVDVEEITTEHVRISTSKFVKKLDGSILAERTDAFITPARSSPLKPSDIVIPAERSRVLKVNFVDVQQGDGIVVETPDGKVMLIDGGDNQLFARYLAARYTGTSESRPREIDCILVTHGDADHFQGLFEIYESETNREPKKRLFIAPKRVYHNGLVKRPGKDATGKRITRKNSLGPSVKVGGETILTGLVDNLLEVADAEMNDPFRKWKKALAAWNSRSPIEFRRLSFGDDDAFDFFRTQGLEVQVLGPMITQKGTTSGLKFLGAPPKGPRIGHESTSVESSRGKGLDSSHTINGHSIVVRLRYGGFSYLFAGDLNDEAGRTLARQHQMGEINLRSEVLKVPHHGSADFSGAFLQMVSPVVSVVSSGDETAMKEYIHPRATLVGSLGKYSRVEEPLIFVTELVAFFKLEGWSKLTNKARAEKRGSFFAFSRTAYGIVKTRTDGERLLVYTDSGKADMKEAYAYLLTSDGMAIASKIVRV